MAAGVLHNKIDVRVNEIQKVRLGTGVIVIMLLFIILSFEYQMILFYMSVLMLCLGKNYMDEKCRYFCSVHKNWIICFLEMQEIDI